MKVPSGQSALAKFFARNDFSSLFKERDQKDERLVLKLHPDASFSQFTCSEVNLEDSKANGAHG